MTSYEEIKQYVMDNRISHNEAERHFQLIDLKEQLRDSEDIEGIKTIVMEILEYIS